MKTKISKILGVALTVVMLSSLMMFVSPTPVSAQTNNLWEQVRIPEYGDPGGWVLAGGATVAGPLARAVDGTLYCYSDPLAAPAPTSRLFKSVDGGHTWTCTGFPLAFGPIPPFGYIVINNIACSPTQANVLYVSGSDNPGVNPDNVWKSDNAGATWTLLSSLTPVTPANARVRSLDCYEMTSGFYLVMAAGLGENTLSVAVDDVFIYDETSTFPFWQDQGFSPWADANFNGYVVGGVNVGQVLCANFAPDFIDPTSRQIIAVATGCDFTPPAADDGTIDIAVFDRFGGGTWCAQYASVVIQENPGAIGNRARIGFPTGYSATLNCYFFVGTSAGANLGGIYQVAASGPNLVVLAPPTLAGVDIWSIAVTGASTIVAGGRVPVTGAIVYYNGTPPWSTIFKQPTGATNAYVVIDDEFATNGEAWVAISGNEGGVSFTAGNGCISWDQIGLINTVMTVIQDVSVNGGNIYFASSDVGAVDDSLWKSTDAGVTWSRVFSSILGVGGGGPTPFDRVDMSPTYTTDSTFYFSNIGTQQPYFSTNGGVTYRATLTAVPAPFGSISCMVVRDGSTVVIGTTGGYVCIQAGVGWIPSNTTVVADIISIVFGPGGLTVVGNDTGSVLTNTAPSPSWIPLGALGVLGGANDVYVAISPFYGTGTDTYVYASMTDDGGGTGFVCRWQVGVSTAWARIDNINGAPGDIAPVDGINEEWVLQAAQQNRSALVAQGTDIGLVLSTDGTLYVNDLFADFSGMSRSLDPTFNVFGPAVTAPFFEEIDDTNFGPIAVILSGMWLDEGTSNVLYSIGGANTMWRYDDQLAVNVTGGDSYATDTTLELSWDGLPGARQYDVNCNRDASFLGLAGILQSSGLALGNPALPNDVAINLNVGTTYYWRARVAAQQPCRSRFNDPAYSATTEMPMPSISTDWFAPSINQTEVPINPGFTWQDIFAMNDIEPGAFDFQLSVDNDFSSLLVDTQLDHSIYQLDTPLDYGTYYWWRVRAVKGAAVGDWATGMFKTMEEAAAIYTCGYCGMQFDTQSLLETHIASAHAVAEEGTPVYIWVVIAIGAVLVIAVVVLIARTRAP